MNHMLGSWKGSIKNERGFNEVNKSVVIQITARGRKVMTKLVRKENRGGRAYSGCR